MKNGHGKSIGFGAAAALWWAGLGLIVRASFGSDTEPAIWFFAATALGLAFGISGKKRRETGRLAPIFGSLIAAAIVYATGGWGFFGIAVSLFALAGAGAMIGRSVHGYLPGTSIGAGLGMMAAAPVIGAIGTAGCLLAGALLMALFLPGGRGAERAAGEAGADGPAVRREPGSGRIALLLAGAGASLLGVAWGRVGDLTAGGTLSVQFAFHGALAIAFGAGAALAFRRFRHVRAGAGAALILAAAGAWVLYTRHGELPWFHIRQLADSLAPYQQNWQENILFALLVAAPWSLFLGLSAGVIRRPAGLRSLFIGLAAGALVAGPVFSGGGVKGTVLLGTQLVLFGGVLFWLRAPGLLWKIGGVAAAAGAIFFVFPSAPSWLGSLYATAPYRYASVYANQTRAAFEVEHVTIPTFYEEGRLWTSSAIAYPSGRQLRLDGAIRCNDQWTPTVEMLMARIPLLFRTEWEKALVLGLGTGVIPSAFGERGPQKIDVVEPEPSIVAASRSFGATNAEYWNDERITLHDGDPRPFVSRAGKAYDLIVTTPIAPWDRRTAHLGTHEFFESAANSLREGGVYVHWLPLSGLPLETLQLQVRTFAAVFPHVVGFRPSNNQGLILIGSSEDLRIPFRTAKETWEEAAVSPRLRALNLGGVPRLLTLLRLDTGTANTFAGEGALNTDRRPRVEWAASAAILDLDGDSIDDRLRALHTDGRDLMDFDGATEQEITRFFRTVAQEYRGAPYPLGGYRYARTAYEREMSTDNLITYAWFVRTQDRDFDRSIALLKQAAAQSPDNLTPQRLLGEEYLLAERYPAAEAYADRLIAGGMDFYWPYMVRGQARLQMGRPNEGLADLLAARERDRHQDMAGNITYNIAVAYYTLGDYEQALEYARATIGRNPLNRRARLLEAETQTRLGTMSRKDFERDVEAPFYRVRASSLFSAAQDNFYEVDLQKDVERDLAVIINSTPNHIGAYLLLARYYHDRGNKEKEGEVLSRMIAQFDADKAVMSAFEDYLLRTGGRKKYDEFRFIPERLLGSDG
ncbi:MAG: hypothetical protein HKN20_15030 [Gemmatimonadetes bacterium]|nr:hypothetical protein [Gemmatimonadota bacterium]